MKKQPAARPGGRSAQIRTKVFDAVEALLAKNPNAMPSMGEIAARAGVNPTSLYRRWGDAGVLAVEVAIERLMQDSPIPDTGTLRGDLLGWAVNAAHSLSGKKDLALLRVLAASTHISEEMQDKRVIATARRGQEMNVVLERAQARGETVPTLPEVLEIVLAPIYFRALFFGAMREEEDVARLVDRALALAAKPSSAASRKDAKAPGTRTRSPRRS
jgi:AcrR family transcriptional regulator